MIRNHHLVIGQLENISWEVIEKYRPIIRDIIRGKSGIYALYNDDELYYVGLATNLMRRLNDHLKDRHKGKWDRFSVYLTRKDEHMKELESLFLRIFKPPGNSVKGKFKNSDNLWPDVRQRIRYEQRVQIAHLKGSSIPSSCRKLKSLKPKGAKKLVELVNKRIKLKASYKGYEYTATLRKNGTIYFDGYIYNSPTAAAKEIVKGSVNGWRFWKYKDNKGSWIALNNIKK